MGSMSEGKERIVAEHPKAWVEGCGEDAVSVERAFGAVFEFLSERGGGVKRNSRGGGKVVFGVVASRRFGAGFRVRAHARMALDVFIGEMVGCRGAKISMGGRGGNSG